MKLYTSSEMKKIDSLAISKHGVSGYDLMDNAGREVAKIISTHYTKDLSIGIVCGKGNNGGDGYVTAKYLSQKGYENISIVQTIDISHLKGEAKKHFEELDTEKIKILGVDKLDQLKNCQVIIDALLGTGLNDEVKEPYKQVINFINALDKEVVSIDIPSGLSSDMGTPHGIAIKAKETITLGGAKVGVVLAQAAKYVGHLHVADIGIPENLLKSNKKLLTKELIQNYLPKREEEDHKGKFGHVLAVGGSSGMEGAIELSALSALRSGCGLVTVVSFSEIQDKVLEVMHHKLSWFWKIKLKKLLNKKNALALGPGLGISPKSKKLIQLILENYKGELVIDADALNCLAEMGQNPKIEKLIRARDTEPILTPHPGEFARLTHYTAEEIQANRAELALEFAKKWNVILVLKGSGTVIASPIGEVFINPTGNPGMATAGMGDVLTGMIAGFLAQGVSSFKAAQLGVYLHGLCGDHVRDSKGEAGLVASDVIESIPTTLHSIFNV